MEAIDYLRDSGNDLVIENGDFKKGDATLKHQHALLVCEKGSYKQFPTICLGLLNFLLDDDTDALQQEIQHEFEKDGMQVKVLKINSLSDIEVVAEYK